MFIRLGAFLVACVGMSMVSCAGTPNASCSPTTCGGCCDSAGRCQTGSASSACGHGGGNCSACGATQTCNALGVCAAQNNTCSAANCNGCCAPNGTCITPSNTPSACGAAGAACQVCMGQQTCTNGACAGTCVPQCAGLVCGSDQCGGSCGTCPGGTSCNAQGQCMACTPQCTGLQCGSDQCGGSCGTCPGGSSCTAQGQCMACTPQCGGRQCGSDTCGGSCGTCPGTETCTASGQCQSTSADAGACQGFASQLEAACVPTGGAWGTAMSATFGRIDGTVTAIATPSSSGCDQTNSTHLIIEVTMGGAMYPLVINVNDTTGNSPVYFAELNAPLAGVPWQDGWHTDAAEKLDYVNNLSVHSTAFSPVPINSLVDAVDCELVPGDQVSIYALGWGTNGGHDIHRNTGGGGADGAVVIHASSANPHYMMFRFVNQTF